MCQFNKLHKYVSLLAVLPRGNEFKFFNEKKKKERNVTFYQLQLMCLFRMR